MAMFTLDVLLSLNSSAVILFVCRFVRLFGFGCCGVVLAVYLHAAGVPDHQLGLLLTLTILGDSFISLVISLNADRLGRRLMLLVGTMLAVLGAAAFALDTKGNFWVLVVAATIGVISPSGNEVGPFMALEQSMLSDIVAGSDRTMVFAWHSFFGYIATSLGSLSSGYLVLYLMKRYNMSALDSYRVVFIEYGATAFILALLIMCLGRGVEARALQHKAWTDAHAADVEEGAEAPRGGSPDGSRMSLSRRSRSGGLTRRDNYFLRTASAPMVDPLEDMHVNETTALIGGYEVASDHADAAAASTSLIAWSHHEGGNESRSNAACVLSPVPHGVMVSTPHSNVLLVPHSSVVWAPGSNSVSVSGPGLHSPSAPRDISGALHPSVPMDVASAAAHGDGHGLGHGAHGHGGGDGEVLCDSVSSIVRILATDRADKNGRACSPSECSPSACHSASSLSTSLAGASPGPGGSYKTKHADMLAAFPQLADCVAVKGASISVTRVGHPLSPTSAKQAAGGVSLGGAPNPPSHLGIRVMSEDPPAAALQPVKLFGLSRKSLKTVAVLSSLFALDAFGASLVTGTLMAYYFQVRFQMPISYLGGVLSISYLLAGIGALFSGHVANKIGLVNTMVFTHIPSNLFLIMVPLMPNVTLATLFVFLRSSIGQMDVVPRNSYVSGVVPAHERTATMGITNVVRSWGAACGPLVTGYLAANRMFGHAFFLSGAIMTLYDIILLLLFRSQHASHETAGQQAVPQEVEQNDEVQVKASAEEEQCGLLEDSSRSTFSQTRA